MKKIIAKKLESFSFFYSVLKGRMFMIVGLSLVVGVLDSIGLSLFMPLLQLIGGSQSSPVGGGAPLLSWFYQAAAWLHLEFNLVTALVSLVGFFVVKGVVRYFELLYTAYAQEHFIRTVRNQLLDDFNRSTYVQYAAADMGQTQNVMTAEVERLSQAVIYYLRALQQFIMVLAYVGLAFLTNPVFAILVSVGGVLTNLAYKFIQDRTRLASARFSVHANQYQSKIMQHISFFKYLKATGSLPIFAAQVRTAISEVEQQRKYIHALGAINMAIREPVLIIIIASVLVVQVSFMHSAIAPIMVSLLLFYRALSCLANMQLFDANFIQNSGSIKNINDFRAGMSGTDMLNYGTGTGYSQLKRNLSMSNVTVKFGSRTVLRDINLCIKKNETVALVGASGCGKSTLLSLLSGLYAPSAGTFEVDGCAVQSLDLQAFQRRIGFITQEPVIFVDSVFNNITLWAEPTPENKERFKAVVQQAALGEYLNQLPEKEWTLLGHNGVNLSGGQRQRIAIARELFKEIDILVLDEATSALDSATEKIIQQNIDALRGKYTILIVAHRLSTIRNVDRVVLLDRGRIAGEGNFETLFHTSEKFRSMVQLQSMETAAVC